MRATIQCREFFSQEFRLLQDISPVSISWNKISMAVPEAIQLLFGFCFFFTSRSQMSLCYTWLEDPAEVSFRVLF